MVRIFISWSGEPTRILAEQLREWLKDVVQTADVYVSSKDIQKGTRWTNDVNGALSEIDFGLILLTAANKTAPWLMFEAGALSKNGKAIVIPVLCDLPPLQIPSPLQDRQAITLAQDDLRSLATIVDSLAPQSLGEDRLKRSFDRAWPDLKAHLDNNDYKTPKSPVVSEAERLERIEGALSTLLRQSVPRPAPAFAPLPPRPTVPLSSLGVLSSMDGLGPLGAPVISAQTAAALSSADLAARLASATETLAQMDKLGIRPAAPPKQKPNKGGGDA